MHIFNKLLLSFFFFNLIFLSACQNTVQGFGKDMQKSGEEIQRSVQ